ncbi:hypothetical protein HELRODRAFT_166698 [Helobdella robusta]|uniref:Uncharacterized protein n=1 Tax=Helobdella robusta TaxID=6412 RepID=T1EYD9_HELRO|nr:hypothetical protein HELRODRAFT_166698 [Helobdella robusta]ESO11683.1 hypothetical protein HELRODRAFT_166698 [Helobdella robusta]
MSLFIGLLLTPVSFVIFLIGSLYYSEVLEKKLSSFLTGFPAFRNVSVGFDVNKINLMRGGVLGHCKKSESIFSLGFDIVDLNNETISLVSENVLRSVDKQIKSLNLTSLPIFQNDTFELIKDVANIMLTFPVLNVSVGISS